MPLLSLISFILDLGLDVKDEIESLCFSVCNVFDMADATISSFEEEKVLKIAKEKKYLLPVVVFTKCIEN